jgi:exodeoxyribonuclease V gamma subunit
VAFHLTVAGSLEPLADQLAEVLSNPLSDPFASEFVAVPGDGVKAWLNARLARRLGASQPGTSDDGIVANVDYQYPATVVTRALGENAGLGRWATGPLTWAIHDVLVAAGPTQAMAEFGSEPDVIRARAIADLFDRYGMYRQDMVLRWSQGADVNAVGAPLESHHLWQPRLWRAVQTHIGGPTDAERTRELTEQLRDGLMVDELASSLPERVCLFGLASLPPPHLQVLSALSLHRDVHVFAPSASQARWERVRPLVRDRLPLPIRRGTTDEQELTVAGGNPLVNGWGRASREAHVLLIDAANNVVSTVTGINSEPTGTATSSLLGRLQQDLRADVMPPGAPIGEQPDERTPIDPTTDQSLRWHRAYGPARQVEVLRDVLIRLLDETNDDGTFRFHPRDIAVLTPDVARFAPLVEATFAGDPRHGVPALPVRVADRTLRADDPLLDTLGALLAMLGGRFRATEVVSFATRQPVRNKFGFTDEALARIGSWARATNVRWGLSSVDHERAGIPDSLVAHTWSAGLDQLLIGATMSDDGLRLGIGDVAPFTDIEGSQVVDAGALADFIHSLNASMIGLQHPSTVNEWCDALTAGLRSLCAVPDADAWRWRAIEKLIEGFRDDAVVDEQPRHDIVDAAELAALLRSRLAGAGGRPRFGTGSITVSALTAQRGVPHKVVCLLGLDDDIGAGGMAVAEDLVAVLPCLGDRDQRSEQRAQLLDAVLCAGDRLLVFSTGHDLRTNTELPPAVAIAELFDTVDATFCVDGVGTARMSAALTTSHPRQAWSEPALEAGALGIEGPWSFDRGALAAAVARRDRQDHEAETAKPLAAPKLPAGGLVERVSIADFAAVGGNPAQMLLKSRLGLTVLTEDDDLRDAIELNLGGLDEWSLANALLSERLEAGDDWGPDDVGAWSEVERARGAVPPLSFGNTVMTRVSTRIEGLRVLLVNALQGAPWRPEPVAVRLEREATDRTVLFEGTVPGVVGNKIMTVTASRLKDRDLLASWVRLAALTLHDPTQSWQSVTIGRSPKDDKLAVQRLSLRSKADAEIILGFMTDFWERSRSDAVPFFPSTSRAVHDGDWKEARSAWDTNRNSGERSDRWANLLFDVDFDELRKIPLSDDESPIGDGYGGRLAYWSHRVWGTFAETTVVEETIHKISDVLAGSVGATADDDEDGSQ